MNSYTGTWKHQNVSAPLPRASIKNTVVFDDEQPGFLTLYYSDGILFYPCRSISTEDPAHLHSTLAAWHAAAPLLDQRLNKSVALLHASPA